MHDTYRDTQRREVMILLPIVNWITFNKQWYSHIKNTFNWSSIELSLELKSTRRKALGIIVKGLTSLQGFN